MALATVLDVARPASRRRRRRSPGERARPSGPGKVEAETTGTRVRTRGRGPARPCRPGSDQDQAEVGSASGRARRPPGWAESTPFRRCRCGHREDMELVFRPGLPSRAGADGRWPGLTLPGARWQVTRERVSIRRQMPLEFPRKRRSRRATSRSRLRLEDEVGELPSRREPFVALEDGDSRQSPTSKVSSPRKLGERALDPREREPGGARPPAVKRVNRWPRRTRVLPMLETLPATPRRRPRHGGSRAAIFMAD